MGWYKTIRFVRDLTHHRGGQTMTFANPEDGICFQLMKGQPVLEVCELVMYNKNVVDFRLYAGMYIAQTLTALERLASLVFDKILDKQQINNKVMANYYGIDVAKKWLLMLQKRIKDESTI